MRGRWRTLAWILPMVLIVACGGRGRDDRPSIKILSPFDQRKVVLGEAVRFEWRARDDGGVSSVELRINGFQPHTTAVPKGEKSFRVVQNWVPPQAGTYYVTLIAYDNKGQASEPVTVTINVRPAPAPASPP
jgi:hypothetical protein